MKKLLSLMLTMLCNVAAWSTDGDVFTATTTEGVEMTFKVLSEANKTCQVARASSGGELTPAISCETEGPVTIPDNVNGYSVVKIDETSFLGCSKITSVVLPSTLTEIGYSAFQGCVNMTFSSLPDNLETLNGWAFYGCSSLTSVTIPKNVTHIGYSVFSYCDNLESLEVEWGNSIYSSPDNCNGIVQKRWKALIVGCKNTTIPGEITTIYDRAFEGCRGLTSIEIPENVTKIDDSAFYDCSGITTVKIPSSVSSIGSLAFQNCNNLNFVEISEGVESIGANCFNSCSCLKQLEIPQSVKTLGDGFFDCNTLEVLTVNWTTPISLHEFYKPEDHDIALLVPLGCKEAYQSSEHWKDFTIIVDDTFTALTEEGVKMRFKITDEDTKQCEVFGGLNGNLCAISNNYQGQLTIPSEANGYTVVGIGERAFYQCNGLTEVAIPNYSTYIGNSAFAYCI